MCYRPITPSCSSRYWREFTIGGKAAGLASERSRAGESTPLDGYKARFCVALRENGGSGQMGFSLTAGAFNFSIDV